MRRLLLTFFELRIRVDDLTGENSLIVTDFADDEAEDAQDLWHAQVDKLRRVLGCFSKPEGLKQQTLVVQLSLSDLAPALLPLQLS